jgi:hypothetical protein
VAHAGGADRAGTGNTPLLARSRSLTLRSGLVLTTPLLVPSLSSKGFQFRQDGLSEVAAYLEVARDHLTESLLISAYDLHHAYLPDAERFLGPDHWSTVYAAPSLLIVDSGGYELSPTWDGSEVYRGQRPVLPFTRQEHEQLVDHLPRDRDLLVVTYDHLATDEERPGYGAQLKEAAAFFGARTHVLSDVLLKPPAGARFVAARDLAPHAVQLAGFDVVGLTESELGDTLLDRLMTVAALRTSLDEAGVVAPIHLFGALDPLFVTLYFMAGAELFDGLTWLRYGYHAGVSVYRESAGLLDGDLDVPRSLCGGRVQLRYLGALVDLKRSLRRWVQVGGEFAVLPYHQEELERAYRALMSRRDREKE